MRLASSLLLAGSVAILAGCSANPGGDAPAGDPIECALAGAKAFKRDCTLERLEKGGVHSLVVHSPDGGFRRFEQQAGGAIVLADGAGSAQVEAGASFTEVTVGKDRYRIPNGTASHAARP